MEGETRHSLITAGPAWSDLFPIHAADVDKRHFSLIACCRSFSSTFIISAPEIHDEALEVLTLPSRLEGVISQNGERTSFTLTSILSFFIP